MHCSVAFVILPCDTALAKTVVYTLENLLPHVECTASFARGTLRFVPWQGVVVAIISIETGSRSFLLFNSGFANGLSTYRVKVPPVVSIQTKCVRGGGG